MITPTIVKNKRHLIEIIKAAAPDADLNHLDISRVRDMSRLFSKKKFNGDISNWDVSKM